MPKRSSECGMSGRRKARTVKTYAISNLEWKQVEPLLRAKVVNAARMTVTRYSFRRGGRFPHHVHNQEQITYVLNGQLSFVVGNQFYRLRSGDLIVIPTGVPHSAEAGWAGAEALSIVSPARGRARPLIMLEPDHTKKRSATIIGAKTRSRRT